MTNLVVGQTLLFVPDKPGFSQARKVTVQTINRKYAYCDGLRVDKRTLVVVGDRREPIGRCYREREEITG